jgi:hypothetical protein
MKTKIILVITSHVTPHPRGVIWHEATLLKTEGLAGTRSIESKRDKEYDFKLIANSSKPLPETVDS